MSPEQFQTLQERLDRLEVLLASICRHAETTARAVDRQTDVLARHAEIKSRDGQR